MEKEKVLPRRTDPDKKVATEAEVNERLKMWGRNEPSPGLNGVLGAARWILWMGAAGMFLMTFMIPFEKRNVPALVQGAVNVLLLGVTAVLCGAMLDLRRAKK